MEREDNKYWEETAYKITTAAAQGIRNLAVTNNIRSILSPFNHLIGFTDKDGRTSLHIALLNNNYDILDALIDITPSDSILSIADKVSNDTILTMLMKIDNITTLTRNRILTKLLQHKINVNHKDINGYTALHIAAQKNYTSATQILLNNRKLTNININSKTLDGKTPLHLAVKKYYTLSVAKLLSEDSEINFDIIDNESKTPLITAIIARNYLAVMLIIEKDEDYQGIFISVSELIKDDRIIMVIKDCIDMIESDIIKITNNVKLLEHQDKIKLGSKVLIMAKALVNSIPKDSIRNDEWMNTLIRKQTTLPYLLVNKIIIFNYVFTIFECVNQ